MMVDAVLYFGERRVVEVEVSLEEAGPEGPERDQVELAVPSRVGLSLPADARLQLEDGTFRGLEVQTFETGLYQGGAFVRAWLTEP